MGKLKKGQSLVEVTVALGILGFVMVGIITLGINVIGYAINAKAQTQGTTLAQQGLEIARNGAPLCGGYTGGDYKVSASKDFIEPAANEPNASGFQGFTRTINIRDILSSEEGIIVPPSYKGYQLIIVTVEWEIHGAPINQKSVVYGLISK